MSQTRIGAFSRLHCPVSLALLIGCPSASCAHTAPARPVVREPMTNPAAQTQPQDPANEVRVVEVVLHENRVDARAELPAGAFTFSFSNDTDRERTAEIEGKGGPWRVDRSIPAHRSMTLEVVLEPGEYVLVSRAGRTRLTAKFRVLKPTSSAHPDFPTSGP